MSYEGDEDMVQWKLFLVLCLGLANIGAHAKIPETGGDGGATGAKFGFEWNVQANANGFRNMSTSGLLRGLGIIAWGKTTRAVGKRTHMVLTKNGAQVDVTGDVPAGFHDPRTILPVRGEISQIEFIGAPVPISRPTLIGEQESMIRAFIKIVYDLCNGENSPLEGDSAHTPGSGTASNIIKGKVSRLGNAEWCFVPLREMLPSLKENQIVSHMPYGGLLIGTSMPVGIYVRDWRTMLTRKVFGYAQATIGIPVQLFANMTSIHAMFFDKSATASLTPAGSVASMWVKGSRSHRIPPLDTFMVPMDRTKDRRTWGFLNLLCISAWVTAGVREGDDDLGGGRGRYAAFPKSPLGQVFKLLPQAVQGDIINTRNTDFETRCLAVLNAVRFMFPNEAPSREQLRQAVQHINDQDLKTYVQPYAIGGHAIPPEKTSDGSVRIITELRGTQNLTTHGNLVFDSSIEDSLRLQDASLMKALEKDIDNLMGKE